MSRALVLAWMLAGCGESVPVNSPPPLAPAPPPKVADAAPAAPEDQYYYNPAGKRDPFQGFLNRGSRDGADLPADAPPLQRYDVDKFTLKGVIWNTDSPRALLVDPEGLGHVVRLGAYVGRNWGKVTSISEDGVVVTEEFQDPQGELIVNPVSVGFAKDAKK
ncbi:MAG: pilus assembly protein PilP [Myxococcota bacterium]